MLSKIRTFFEEKSKKVLGVIIFGSYIYNPLKARDIDLLVIVNSLKNIQEKVDLEVEASIELRKAIGKPVDTHVFDLETFKENLKPGSFLSGLTLGYKILYDEVGLVKAVKKLIKKISEIREYVYVKKRVWDLASIAKTKILN